MSGHWVFGTHCGSFVKYQYACAVTGSGKESGKFVKCMRTIVIVLPLGSHFLYRQEGRNTDAETSLPTPSDPWDSRAERFGSGSDRPRRPRRSSPSSSSRRQTQQELLNQLPHTPLYNRFVNISHSCCISTKLLCIVLWLLSTFHDLCRYI